MRVSTGYAAQAVPACGSRVVRYLEPVTWLPMSLVIETERLTLRLRDERDAAWYRELVAERSEDMPTLDEATTRLARFRDLTNEIGIGALAICRRSEGDVIGYCALVVGRCSLDEPEIAYELLRRFHGHGYATEAAQALVDAAAATGQHRLWSTVRPWNTASLRVLEKIGPELGRGRTLLAITPSQDADWVGDMLRLKRRDIAPAVLLLDRASFIGEASREISTFCGLLADHAIPVHVIDKSYVFRPVAPIKRKRTVLKTLSGHGRVVAVEIEEEI